MNTYTFSNRFNNLSFEEQQKVIEIGEYVYFNGLKLYNSDELDKEIYANKKRLEEIRNQHENQLHNHTTMVREQYESIVESKQELINSKLLEIEDLKERIKKLEEENCQALSLSGKLDSLMGKGNTVDNAMKGDFGESIVANQIQHWYQTSEIEDKSAETAKGDLHWKLNDDFCALVEVKNVQFVRPSEIQKFERDISINIKDSSCNCGIFISIKTETIPGKGKFKLEFFEGHPIIYVSNVLNDLNTLRFALDSLYNIHMKMKEYYTKDTNESTFQFENDIIEFIQNLYNKLSVMSSNINQMKQSVEALNNCLNIEENNIKELCSNIIHIRSKNDILKHIELEYKTNCKQDLKEKILRDMRLFQKENGRVPMMSDMLGKYKQSVFRDDLAFKKLKSEL